MEPPDQFKRVASTNVFCRRCSRPMAIQRLRYADPASGFSSVRPINASLAGMRTCSRISLKIYRRQPISFARLRRLTPRASARKDKV